MRSGLKPKVGHSILPLRARASMILAIVIDLLVPIVRWWTSFRSELTTFDDRHSPTVRWIAYVL
jgi:hypothetical protein